MRLLLGIASLASLLASCEARRPDTAATPPPTAPAPPETAFPAAPLPDTVDNMRAYRGDFRSWQTDTLVAIGPRHYWLHLSQVADSTQPLEYAPAAVAGKYFAAPSDTAWRAHRVRGYEGTYTFTLRDSARQKVVFSQKLHKRDFLPSH